MIGMVYSLGFVWLYAFYIVVGFKLMCWAFMWCDVYISMLDFAGGCVKKHRRLKRIVVYLSGRVSIFIPIVYSSISVTPGS